MLTLDLPATDTTPRVHHDPSTSILRIEGESYPEDVVAFYAPVIAWLRQHLATAPASLTVQFALRYLNTSSSKAMLDLLLLLDEHHRRQIGIIKVEWHYDPEIEVMLETGEDFGGDLAVPYKLVPHT